MRLRSSWIGIIFEIITSAAAEKHSSDSRVRAYVSYLAMATHLDPGRRLCRGPNRASGQWPLTLPLSPRRGRGRKSSRVRSDAASHPNPLSIQWRKGEENAAHDKGAMKL